jgi:hypothetical protein
VIVLVINDLSIGTDESKGHPPVATHPHSPCTLSGAFEWMELQARKAHVFWFRRRVQATQNQAQPFRMFGLNPGLGSGFKELREALVPEALDHDPQCNP